MNVPFVVFDVATGNHLWHGICPEEAVIAQASVGQRALATSALTVDGNRIIIWNAAKEQREHYIDGGAATPVGIVDSDSMSRSNISGAAIGAMLAKNAGAPYSVTWTLLDNSTVILDADGMLEMAIAVLTHVNSCHERARQLRAEIESASNMAELLAIDVTAGWP